MNPFESQFLNQSDTLQKSLPTKDKVTNENQTKVGTQKLEHKSTDRSFQSQILHKNLTTKIVRLDEYNLQDVTTLLTKNLTSVNSVWKHYNLPYDEVRVSIRGKLIPALNQSFVILVNGLVAGAFLQFDIYDYLKLPQMPNHLKFFYQMRNVGEKLEAGLNRELIDKKGITSYGIFGVIDQAYAKLGLSEMFWWRCFSELKLCGYKNYYARISSDVPLKMLLRLGAKIISQAVIQSGDLKQKLWMIQVDLSKPFPTYKQFKEMRVKYKNNKPKL